MSVRKVGQVLSRGTVPCRECRQPHVERIKELDPLMTTWATAEDGHFYQPMTAEEVVQHLRPLGMINRKMACPDCGPKFERGHKKFLREVDALLKKETKATTRGKRQ